VRTNCYLVCFKRTHRANDALWTNRPWMDNYADDLVSSDTNKQYFRKNTTFRFPLDYRYLTRPKVILQPLIIRAVSAYFGADKYYYLPTPTTYESYYSPFDSSGDYASVTLEMDAQQETYRFIPVSVFNVIAVFGQLVATMFIGNILIRRINYMWFFIRGNESFYVPDVSIRKALLSNRKIKLKEFENLLMYALSFGSTERFGVQTRHLFEFFHDRSKRFDRQETRAVIEDIQKFTTNKRMGGFVTEDEKKKGEVESNFDVARIQAERILKGRLSNVQDSFTNPKDLEVEEQQKALAEDTTIKEAEVAMKLVTIQDELNKLKVLAATMFPQQAKNEKLSDKLSGKING